MAQLQALRRSAQTFAEKAITDLNGERPSQKTVRLTAERIVKALAPVVSQAAPPEKRDEQKRTR